ncbi:MAG: carboxypeptidase-like regulatory domain-containing protein [Candidatus Sumerlaeota bacterium]|nr:carboxypeptidase-like regulatory domain-containing protein [Candidatus Sumerlaeota bacterium]
MKASNDILRDSLLMRLTTFFIYFAIATSAAAAAESRGKNTPGIIKGHVIETPGRNPVTSFTVSILRLSRDYEEPSDDKLFQSAEGLLEFDNLDKDALYIFCVKAPSFSPHIHDPMRPSTSSHTSETLIELKKAKVIRGLLCDSQTSRPIAGAKVSYHNWDPPHGPVDPFCDCNNQTVTTGEDGRFQVFDGPCTSEFTVEAPGYSPDAKEFFSKTADGVLESVTLLARKKAALRGTIAFEGVPIAGAEVHLMAVSKKYGVTRTVTDKKGDFFIDDIYPDAHVIYAIVQREAIVHGIERPIEIMPGVANIFNLDVAGSGSCKLSGQLFMDHQPLPPKSDVNIGLRYGEWSYSIKGPGDALPSYRFAGLQEGQHIIEISIGLPNHRQVFRRDTIEVKGGVVRSYDLSSRLIKARLIFDRIPAGWPSLEKANVNFVNCQPSAIELPEDYHNYAYVDNNKGLLTCDEPLHGAWTLRIHSKSFIENNWIEIRHSEMLALNNFQSDQDLGDIHVAPYYTGALVGTIKDDASSLVCSMQVFIKRISPSEPEGRHPPEIIYNGNGGFSFFGLREGEYEIHLQKTELPYGVYGRHDTRVLNERVWIQGLVRHEFVFKQ